MGRPTQNRSKEFNKPSRQLTSEEEGNEDQEVLQGKSNHRSRRKKKQSNSHYNDIGNDSDYDNNDSNDDMEEVSSPRGSFATKVRGQKQVQKKSTKKARKSDS